MPLDEPSWWYSGRSDDWRARALQPIARVYGWGTMRRFARAEPFRASLPVICVGNFTAGGTGKTPLSLLLAEMLRELGKTPVFLTRGYSGTMTGPDWVDPAIHDARDVGDEPMLLAAAAPTMLSRDRAAGARAIAARVPPASVIIMDDGLQNPALRKDMRLAVVDGLRGIGNGELIPAGPLRAPLPFQFAMTDAIIVNCPPSGAGAAASKAEPGILAHLRHTFPGPVLAAAPEPAGDTAWLTGTPVIAFAGIANPQRFFRLLESLGADLVSTIAYRDHHRFTPAEVDDLLAQAKATGAQLVTTEKDLARLEETRLGEKGEAASARLRRATRSLPIRLRFNGNDLIRMQALVATLFADCKDQQTP